MVTRLDLGPEAGRESAKCGSGVVARLRIAGSVSIFIAESLLASRGGSKSPEPGASSSGDELADSTDRLREAAVREVRRRFRDVSVSSKGLGRVEQGSEEEARSLSI